MGCVAYAWSRHKMSHITETCAKCPGYLMKTPAGLVVLAPQAVGASQVEEHHGASRGHTARVAHGDLLPCCGQTDGHTLKNTKNTGASKL